MKTLLSKKCKVCKITVDGKKYPLSLLDMQLAYENLSSKILAFGLRYTSPFFLGIGLFCMGYQLITLGTIDPAMLQSLIHIIPTGIMFSNRTICGASFNAMVKLPRTNRKVRRYYEKMRTTEMKLTPKNSTHINKKRQRLTRRILKSFKKESAFFDKRTKKWREMPYEELSNKVFTNTAFTNMDTNQEIIDKFIYYNYDLLYELCPEYEEFMVDRFNKRLEHFDKFGIYDEYFQEMMYPRRLFVKTDCVDERDNKDVKEECFKSLTDYYEIESNDYFEYDPSIDDSMMFKAMDLKFDYQLYCARYKNKPQIIGKFKAPKDDEICESSEEFDSKLDEIKYNTPYYLDNISQKEYEEFIKPEIKTNVNLNKETNENTEIIEKNNKSNINNNVKFDKDKKPKDNKTENKEVNTNSRPKEDEHLIRGMYE